jgi:hypothetical protein
MIYDIQLIETCSHILWRSIMQLVVLVTNNYVLELINTSNVTTHKYVRHKSPWNFCEFSRLSHSNGVADARYVLSLDSIATPHKVTMAVSYRVLVSAPNTVHITTILSHLKG